MKGVIFTEFLDMVEEVFSPEVADRIIDAADLPSGGAYTSVGSYDHMEMVALVKELSAATDTPMPDLMKVYGQHLFGRFVDLYPNFFEGESTAFQFLNSVENYIHVEVRKLYPEAELPELDCENPDPDQMVMVYRSCRGFADVAEGLIRGCIDHFGETIAIDREDRSGGRNTEVCFRLQAQA